MQETAQTGAIWVYNTLTGRREPLRPLVPGQVSIYVCGPTPYDTAHIGHARPAVVWDVVKRHLRARGYLVRHVQNFTDIDDKLIARSRQLGISVAELAERHIAEYLAAMDRLGVEPADFYPRVTANMDAIVEYVDALQRGGYAYVADGDVYFAVARDPDYGRLSHRTVAELMQGVRHEVAPGKRAPEDFALWKGAGGEEPAWPSPWGPGRPGWHIECSTLARRYLGDRFDFHGGGVDLVFPHHENERAQSRARLGQEPASIWWHTGLVTVDAVKMSKSLGNGVGLADLLDRYPAHVLRTFLLSVHPRSPLAFSFEALEGWGRGLERVERLWEEVAATRFAEAMPGAAWVEELWGFGARFRAALDDDFNTARALAEVFETVREGFRLLETAGLPRAERATAAYLLHRALRLADEVLGLLPRPTAPAAEAAAEVWLQELLDLREAARRRRDFAAADAIRDRLAAHGWQVEDTPRGPRLRRGGVADG